MSQEEKFGNRDLTYSAWHRRNSTRRYVGIENAQLLAMVDLDMSLYVEYDDKTKEPLALIEIAEDISQENKTATITLKLAQRAELPCMVVLYKKSNKLNPANNDYNDIEQFRIKRLFPQPEKIWRILTPKEWAEKLLILRQYSSKMLDEIFCGNEKIQP